MKGDKVLDCKGLACPMPIVKLSKGIKEVNSGQVLEVVADDPAFIPDVKAWCAKMGHGLVGTNEAGGIYTAFIKRS